MNGGSSKRLALRSPSNPTSAASLSLSLLPLQQQFLHLRQPDHLDPRREAIGFLPAVHDEGLVRGNVLHGGEEAGLQHGRKAALDFDGPGFPGPEFQDEVDLCAEGAEEDGGASP